MKDYFISIFISIIAIFAPIKALLLVTGILIFSDLIAGIIAAKKKGEWTTFSDLKSAALRRTITKICVYNAAIMLGFLTETYMIDGFLPMSKIAAGAVSLVEMKSILEKLDTINGSSIFKTLIERLGSVNDKLDK